MRAGLDAPIDVCVCDVSSRGMLIQAAFPPRRGTYVEVVLARQTVAGRVIWSKGRRFGINTRERLDLGAVASGHTVAPMAHIDESSPRRFKAGLGSRAAPASELGRLLDFGFVLVLVLTLVAVAAFVALETLAGSLKAVSASLERVE